jgi:hypothetical protein
LSNQEQDSGTAPFHQEGSAIIFDKPKSEEEIARRRRENEQHEFARAQVETNRRLAWFTGALVIATFCTIGVGIWQGTLSQKAANAARDAVEVARGTLQETQRSNSRQARLTEASRLSSEVQSHAALQSSIDNFRLDQRAWLGVSDYTYSLGESGTIGSTGIVLNTGKSPASNIHCRITGMTKEKDYVLRDSDLVYPPELPTVTQGTLFPNQHFPLTAGGPPMDPSSQKAWSDNVASGELMQYFFGEVRYKDSFGVWHWTYFCTKYVPSTKSGTPCPIYNDTDQIKNRK